MKQGLPRCIHFTAFSHTARSLATDVRPGDMVQHATGRWKVIGAKVWRETYFPDGAPAPADGYLVQWRY
jgi:hypothetical protein